MLQYPPPFTHITHMLSCSPISHYILSVCTVFSCSHFFTPLCSLTVTFLSHPLSDSTPLVQLIPFSLAVLTKQWQYLSAVFSVDRCDIILAASYLLSDAIATVCRSLLASLLLTSSRVHPLPGKSTLVPLLLHVGYRNLRTNQ